MKPFSTWSRNLLLVKWINICTPSHVMKYFMFIHINLIKFFFNLPHNDNLKSKFLYLTDITAIVKLYTCSLCEPAYFYYYILYILYAYCVWAGEQNK